MTKKNSQLAGPPALITLHPHPQNMKMSQWSLTLISSNINLSSFSVLLLRELPWDKGKEKGGKEGNRQWKQLRVNAGAHRWERESTGLKNCTAALLNFIQQRCYQDKESRASLTVHMVGYFPVSASLQQWKRMLPLHHACHHSHLTPLPRHHSVMEVCSKRWGWTAGLQVQFKITRTRTKRLGRQKRDSKMHSLNTVENA